MRMKEFIADVNDCAARLERAAATLRSEATRLEERKTSVGEGSYAYLDSKITPGSRFKLEAIRKSSHAAADATDDL